MKIFKIFTKRGLVSNKTIKFSNYKFSSAKEVADQSICIYEKKIEFNKSNYFLLLEHYYSKSKIDYLVKSFDPITNTYKFTSPNKFKIIILAISSFIWLDSLLAPFACLYFLFQLDENSLSLIRQMYLHKDGKHCIILTSKGTYEINIKSIHQFSQDSEIGVLYFKAYDKNNNLHNFGISMTSFIYDLHLFSAIMNSNYILFKNEFNNKVFLEANPISDKENDFIVDT